MLADVRFGSLADMDGADFDVRYTPKADIDQVRQVPIAAMNVCSKQTLYSITPSSARASSAGGTARPSAFAVLRFTINSTLPACCTGRSAEGKSVPAKASNHDIR